MPDLPAPLTARLSDEVGEVRSFQTLGGGCIANAGRLETSSGTFFMKWSDGEAQKTFAPEADGLRALRAAGSTLVIPEVAAVSGRGEQPGFLVLDWIEEGSRGADYWQGLGEGLAEMHRHTSDITGRTTNRDHPKPKVQPENRSETARGRYGFDDDNFIGRLPQKNTWHDSWPDFFRDERLAPQVEMARRSRRWRSGWDDPLDHLYSILEDILPAAPEASILHGDLWSGNILATAEGRPSIIDPAVYYGHREADLAMTKLFGGFQQGFYDAYNEAWPIDDGYEQRREIYNLYHLINHLNHFGSSYAGRVDGILRRFG